MLLAYRCLSELLALFLWVPARFLAARGDMAWGDRLARRRLGPADIWLHGASVGEVRLLAFLCRYLLDRLPGLRLHLSVMTKSGMETAAQLIPEATLSFLPLDVPRYMRTRMDQISPQLVVCAEAEIWPGLLSAAARAGARVVLVNARMKERSYRRFARFPRAMKRLLSCYDRFFLRSQEDLERYRLLGAPETAFELAGDMKFDAPVPADDPSARNALRTKLLVGSEDTLLVCGSTRPDEEEQLAPGLRALRTRYPQLRIVVAPRHVHRCQEVASLFASAGFTPILFSALNEGDAAYSPGRPAVVIVDILGILNALYAAGDVAFVGGTLTNTGGHNILEPVWRGRPVFFGPDTASINDAADYVVSEKFGAQVENAAGLMVALERWIRKETLFRKKTSATGARSATARAGDYILKHMDRYGVSGRAPDA